MASRLKPSKYRILSIASIRDALVQAILYEDVLYEPVESLFQALDSPSTVSFAYRKGKSAPQAAQVVYKYAQTGYWHVLDADLSKYFDSIPHDALLDRLALVIGGKESKTFKLVRRFVHVDRVPYGTYQRARRRGRIVGCKIFHWRKPRRERRKRGVPQGGVLSGMLANLYLHDFDEWIVTQLAQEVDLRYVRYADDFIIMVRAPGDLPYVHCEIQSQVEALGLSLNEEKTRHIDIRSDGLEFVGFHFDERHMRVRQRNINRYKERIREVIEIHPKYVEEQQDHIVTLKWLSYRIGYKVQGKSGKERCPKCGCERIGPPRSWMAFFRVVTDIDQLRELDKWTRQAVYTHIYKHYGVRLKRRDLRGVGFKSLVSERYRIGETRLKPCLCDIEARGLWPFANDLFQGRILVTLARKRPFTVNLVGGSSIHLSVGGRQYIIHKDIILQLWEQLVHEGQITRVRLEDEGFQNTSHIVAMLAELPGVQSTLHPIRLHFVRSRPAQFLCLE